jgi:hypothetical protein
MNINKIRTYFLTIIARLKLKTTYYKSGRYLSDFGFRLNTVCADFGTLFARAVDTFSIKII